MKILAAISILAMPAFGGNIENVPIHYFYDDPSAESWEISVYGGSRIIVSEQIENISDEHLIKIANHAKGKGMPVDFHFHLDDESLQKFAKTMFSFINNANKYALKYRITLIAPKGRVTYLRPGITHKDGAENLIIGDTPNDWIWNDRKVNAEEIIKKVSEKRKIGQELDIKIKIAAFHKMHSLNAIIDLFNNLNKYTENGVQYWHYSITIESDIPHE